MTKRFSQAVSDAAHPPEPKKPKRRPLTSRVVRGLIITLNAYDEDARAPLHHLDRADLAAASEWLNDQANRRGLTEAHRETRERLEIITAAAPEGSAGA